MASSKFRVGIIGLTPGRSWAAVAHLPALHRLAEDYELVGVANTSLASAERAAKACGVPRAFANNAELISSPEIDVVAVTVKVPHHREIVAAAAAAGKHVFCEWPLGNGLAEARELASLAGAAGILGVVGTQARVAPAVQYVRDLVRQGYVGDVLSSTLIGSGMAWGPEVDQANAYLLDRANGATMLTIGVGHAWVAVHEVLGPMAELSATLATRNKKVRIVESAEERPMSAADQVVVVGILASGAPMAIHYRGGHSHGTGLLWEINGSAGDLQVTGAGGHMQVVELTIKGASGDGGFLRELAVPESYLMGLGNDTAVGNVARLYRCMASDLRTGSHLAPTFEDAIGPHQLIAAIEQAAETGQRTRPESM
jgi:predicted dehydrogenase